MLKLPVLCYNCGPIRLSRTGSQNWLMDVCLRRLQADDINQVAEIEREAFSSIWVGSPFKRDLNNRFARYLVAGCPHDPEVPPQPTPEEQREQPKDGSYLNRLVKGVQGLVKGDQPPPPDNAFIAGYVAVWFQGDDAHITEIAVREKLRGKGIGELLLVGALRAAVEYGSSVMTLEARVSNIIAQHLYEKYGFKCVGQRRAYYADNREDAVIMTTSPIHSEEYQRMFQQLQEAYRTRWGEIRIEA